MSRIVWIIELQAKAIHNQQLALFGGASGILDEGKLSSALARPRHIQTYKPDVSLHELAAAYAWGIVRNHPFVDGNKRTAFVVMAVFLRVNRIALIVPETEVVVTMLSLAAGEMTEEELIAWLSQGSSNIEKE